MTKNRYIVLVSKNSLEIYSETQKKAVRVDFTPESVIDFEVINRSTLTQQIEAAIEAGKLTPGNILIILTNSVLFQKDFPIAEDKAPEQKFIENIPFENTASLKIPLTKTTERIIAANKDFYETVSDIFTKKNFVVNGTTLTPLLLELNTAESSQNLISQGLKKIDSIKGDMLTMKDKDDKKGKDEPKTDVEEVDESEDIADTSENDSKKKKITPRIIGLLVVFGILILVLFGLVFKMILFPEDINPPATPQSQTQLDEMTIEREETPTPAQADLRTITKSLTVEIQSIQQSATYSARIRDNLQKEGFQNISIVTDPDISSNQILFSDKVVPEVKNRVLDSIVSLIPTIGERTVSNASKDIVLMIGRF